MLDSDGVILGKQSFLYEAVFSAEIIKKREKNKIKETNITFEKERKCHELNQYFLSIHI
jgi:hypothetical protein